MIIVFVQIFELKSFTMKNLREKLTVQALLLPN